MQDKHLFFVQDASRFELREGILLDREWEAAAVTSQFLENADAYHQLYTNRSHWEKLVDLAVKFAGIKIDSISNVLDIGSGSGNSALYAAKLFQNANIVACDISPQLLQILVRLAKDSGISNVSALCFDLHQRVLKENFFDFVIGGSILHHMLNPIETLQSISAAMMPGCLMILYEPLEIGAHLNCIVYDVLLDELESIADPKLLSTLATLINDSNHRFGPDKAKPWTKYLDDKWLFNIPYLRKAAASASLALDGSYPISTPSSTVISDNILSTLSLCGFKHESLPGKVFDILNQFDNSLGIPLKERISQESILVFRKIED